MFSQVYYGHPEPFAGAADEARTIATDPFMTTIYVDPITMGDLAYNYLTQEDPAPYFSDWLGYPLLPDDTSWSIDNPPLGYVSEQATPDFIMSSPSGFPSYFPFTPSPPPSQASTPEREQPALSPHRLSCHQASPSLEIVHGKRKWYCNACGKGFCGLWECNRHIKNAGRRAKCLACNSNISGREDNLERHYYKHCKRMDRGRDSGNVRLEDAFVHV